MNSYGLSPAQLEVWLAHRLASDPGELNVPVTFDVPATIRVDAFRRAFHDVVHECDALRTSIVECEGAVEQRVSDRLSYELPVVDADCESWIGDRAHRPFELDGRLFDAALLRDPSGRVVWYLNQHHIVTDIWSIRLIAQQVAERYRAVRCGQRPPASTACRYAEFVNACEAAKSTGSYEAGQAFWRDVLAAPVPPPALYGIRPGAPRRPFRTTLRIRSGEPASLPRLANVFRSTTMARSRSLPLFARSVRVQTLAVWLACFAAYQHRVSGAERLAIGVPYHNRAPRFRQTPGLFVQIVPVCLTVDPGVAFDELLWQTCEQLNAALFHASVPLPPGSSRFFHSSINLHTGPEAVFDGVTVAPTLHFTGHMHEQVALEVQLDGASGDVVLGFDADGRSIDETRAPRAVQHLLHVLEACTTDPSRRIADVPIVGDEERRQLAVWSRGPSLPVPDTIVAAFDARAAATPSNVAAVDAHTALTYPDLCVRAGRFARWLMVHGVRRGEPVAVAMDRRVDVAVAVLGILKAGCAYLPLDPGAPRERQQFIVRDAGTRLVIADGRYQGAFGDSSGATAAEFPSELLRRDDEFVPERGSQPGADDIAYIIYTSGSTGTPKGVMVPHRALANHAAAAAREYGLSPSDRVLQFSALHFDISIEEMFPTWFAGGTVVFRPDDLATHVDQLMSYVEQQRITVVDLPTAYWHTWVASLARQRPSVPECLRLVIVGGEQPLASAIAGWRAAVGTRVRWINSYGPTETTVVATTYEAGEVADDPVPMGRPLPNVHVHVVNGAGQLCPPGVPGELYIGGVNVAAGYVNAADVTAARFVTIPSLDGPEATLYRTGDLVRFRPDGQLEFLGRIDDQVKIRGYRVEPQEIEAVLARHSNVSAVAVIAAADPEGGDRRLVAYVAAERGCEPDVRAFAREHLPEYMVPAAIVCVDTLPLTRTGKVDRRALPPPRTTPGSVQPEPPRTLLESQIADVWIRLLGVSPIARTASFADLGGHSMLGVRMLAAVEDLVDRPVPVSLMASDLTIARLADAVMSNAADEIGRAVIPLRSGDRTCPIVFFHGDYGGGGLYLTRLARALPLKRALYAVAPHGLDGGDVPPTIEMMARERVADILRSVPEGPCVLGGFCNGGLVAYAAADSLRKHGRDVRAIVIVDATLRTRRFRALGRTIRAVARLRRWTPHVERDAFLRWRDRQLAVQQLLGLCPDEPHRFSNVSLGGRCAFIWGSIRRNMHRLAGRARRPATGDPAGDRFEILDRAYDLATSAYVPAGTDLETVLVVSDDFAALGAEAEWHAVAPRLDIHRLGGAHFESVNVHINEIAAVLEATAAAVDRQRGADAPVAA